MEQVTWNNLGEVTSKLGFGAMRLPTDSTGKIDFPKAQEMLDACMAGGITYYDTAYIYHNGDSEVFLREALVKRYPRDAYQVATKLPIGDLKTPADMDKTFEIQRERLGLEIIDFYLLHCLSKENWENCKRLGGYEYIMNLKKQGKVRYSGFSFHGDPPVLKEVLAACQWDFVQLQINYLDWNSFAEECYGYAREAGVPIIVMEPVRGGALALFPEDISDIFKRNAPDKSKASIALRWLADLEGVSVILSGMSTLDQCHDNIKTFTRYNPLDKTELAMLEEVSATLNAKPIIPCTSCLYCTSSCPKEVYIPNVFTAFNEWILYESVGGIEWNYFILTPPEHRAGECIACGNCVPKCPQGINIPEKLAAAREVIERVTGRT